MSLSKPKIRDHRATDKSQRILIFADWFEPGFRGGGLTRSCLNMASMLKHSNEVYVFTRNSDFKEELPYDGIESDRWLDFDMGIKTFYCSAGNLTRKIVKGIISDVSADIIYLNSMYSYYFSILPLFINFRHTLNAKIILAPRGMLQEGAIRYKAFKKHIYLKFINLIGLLKGVRIHATCHEESIDIQKKLNIANPIILPDLPDLSVDQHFTGFKMTGQVKCLYLSRVTPKKNLQFLLKILANVTARVELKIIGGIDNEEYWHQCQQLIKILPENIKVDYLGLMPHDQTTQHIMDTHLIVLPTFGENFGHVIYESLSHSTPVLISDQTPWKNLSDDCAGWDIPLSHPEKFQNVIEKVAAMDHDLYLEWTEGALQRAKNYKQICRNSDGLRELFNTTFHLNLSDIPAQNVIVQE